MYFKMFYGCFCKAEIAKVGFFIREERYPVTFFLRFYG